MKVILSKYLSNVLQNTCDPRVKIIRKRIQELEGCTCLADMKKGKLHFLKGKYYGTFSLRIGQQSRLILYPIELNPEYANQRKKKIEHFITGVFVSYTINHYKNIQ